MRCLGRTGISGNHDGLSVAKLADTHPGGRKVNQHPQDGVRVVELHQRRHQVGEQEQTV